MCGYHEYYEFLRLKIVISKYNKMAKKMYLYIVVACVILINKTIVSISI